ncbi:CBO0543 family protein [Sediminibacillus massiliensis]|uniref:CBO0543 family protein n=1 Tax=Sediminibacillus massiliensis TaxID=1926277 RepID=UPI000988387F|nr:CBO0543 family protein [Sediminibacillus massiliensis]
MERANELAQQVRETSQEMMQFWLDDILWTWQWWLGVILTIVPWIIWGIFRKKQSTYRLLYAMIAVMWVSAWVDFIAVSTGLWMYYYEVLPFIPSFIPWYFTLIPILIATLLQIKPDANPYIKATICSIIGAFLAEPFFEWVGIYKTLNWEHIYSIPLYFIVYLLAHFISRRKTFKEL